MTIIQVIQKLRDDLKLWVTNNLNVKMNKNLGAEESGKILAVDENGDIITIENIPGVSKVFQVAASTSSNLDTNLFLIDTADSNILKYYNGTSWAPVTVGWG